MSLVFIVCTCIDVFTFVQLVYMHTGMCEYQDKFEGF